MMRFKTIRPGGYGEILHTGDCWWHVIMFPSACPYWVALTCVTIAFTTALSVKGRGGIRSAENLLLLAEMNCEL